MVRPRGSTVEVGSLAEFDRLVAAGASSMSGWLLQDLDLRGRDAALMRLDPAGALMLGCQLGPDATAYLRAGGALLFPNIPELPFDPYRSGLYTPEELYDGVESSYAATPDARIYAWSRRSAGTLTYSLARALHDHAVDDALREALHERRVVGVMGGHDMSRDSPEYADAARLGRAVATAGQLVATGGGPGAMEAANLGAYLAGAGDTALEAAVALLAPTPSYRPMIGDWVRAAFEVRRRWPDGGPSLGIPTWHYGHEPPNAFASMIAKYFQNSLREDTLLRICTAGIVFLPGAGGTVEEVFQDGCENYYADEATVAPMVLVGKEYWTANLPAWPLLRALSAGRPMEHAVHLVQTVEEAVAILT